MKQRISPVLLVQISLIALLGCAKPKAVETTISEERMDNLLELFSELDKVIASNTPALHQRLGDPATDEEIAALREYLQTENQVLEMLFRWHNTPLENSAPLLPLGNSITISEAIHDRELIARIPLVDAKRKASLKILEDGAGDGFFIDITSTDQRVFYHMLEDPYPRYCGEMEDFLRFLIDLHSSGIFEEVTEHNMIQYSYPKYEEIRQRHFPNMYR